MIIKSRGKLVRRFNSNIFGNQRYDRLLSKKPYPPGEIRKGNWRESEYRKQLIEKQKLKFSYGLSERQFRRIFDVAKAMPGITGNNFLALLERRIDNVVYRLGLAISRPQARQMVSHGHIEHNGKKVTIPSITVKVNDVISARDRKQTKDMLRRNLVTSSARAVPAWLSFAKDNLRATVLGIPQREMIPTIAEEQQIVEFYSR